MDYKIKIVELLKNCGFDINVDLITIPPNKKFGDFSCPMFSFAKELKKSPNQIAQDLCSKLSDSNFEKIVSEGPYLNFYINRKEFIKDAINKILNRQFDYLIREDLKKIMVEYISPNSNKPLHIGHLRNLLLGQLYSKLLKKVGNEVVETCLINDRGLHICKSMVAYKKFGNDIEPDIKGDHFVGNYYIEFEKQLKEDPDLIEEANQMLIDWENDNLEVKQLWRKMNDWSESGQKETWQKFGINFNQIYYESQMYKFGKEIVEEGIKKGVFKEDDGVIIADLSDYNLDIIVAIRANGTSLYLVQDLYLAILKVKEYSIDSSVYVIGKEQDHYMRQLFKILELLGFDWAKNLYHLSYGHIELKSGRMKSREGKIVETDDLLKEITDLISVQLVERNSNYSSDELDYLSKNIAMAAIRYYILKFDNKKDFTYDEESSLRFDGDTGVYLLYTYARINSIIDKINCEFNFDNINLNLFEHDIEFELIEKLSNIDEVVKEATKKHKLSYLCNYFMDLAQTFNTYYSQVQILDGNDDRQKTKYVFLKCILIVFEELFDLLSIKPLKNI
ncbi:arginine--tRNA ligase [Candidatus Woesearchaeota archaeon]|jgi:arginyl-tRNA synthetase|nr:arginine--tRNA ligase [Candidatus Woesearchaeota archaeon]MBT4595412.1 arginine--tRNA ligase [Candidatus Woesearchaeota archaeon]MBT5741183.1 arginine--tRNA ligase [Candidatus Woesearchaeota archaeon]MBT6505737.1 arginine--tRNA ligase [Candidatus Woesearchaeota archaeon]MBT7296330.1 arginine--tRNA ligase [Candidatus Woesearchaeota archaeon]